MSLTPACAKALGRLSEIVGDREFPQKVFAGDWSEFFFFDSDWMFGDEFVAVVRGMLEVEGAACALLVSLDAAPEAEPRRRYVVINSDTPTSGYRAALFAGGSENCWLFDYGRFGCASHTGDWCIYCERRNEIGVLAIRTQALVERFGPAVAALRAARFVDAIYPPMAYGFSPRALSPAWRATLLAEYSTARGNF